MRGTTLAASDLKRFLSKARLDGGVRCWEWTAATSKGYGRFWLGGRRSSGGRRALAHRVSYEHFRGPIPAGLELDHLCGVRHCVNPWHLEPVSCRENLLRGDTLAAANASKTHCKSGHPFAGANLYVDPSGGRHCRACDRDGHARRRREVAALISATTT